MANTIRAGTALFRFSLGYSFVVVSFQVRQIDMPLLIKLLVFFISVACSTPAMSVECRSKSPHVENGFDINKPFPVPTVIPEKVRKVRDFFVLLQGKWRGVFSEMYCETPRQTKITSSRTVGAKTYPINVEWQFNKNQQFVYRARISATSPRYQKALTSRFFLKPQWLRLDTDDDLAAVKVVSITEDELVVYHRFKNSNGKTAESWRRYLRKKNSLSMKTVEFLDGSLTAEFKWNLKRLKEK